MRRELFLGVSSVVGVASRVASTLAKGLVTCALVMALQGCGSSDNSEPSVRVFHASPDAPNVDVLVDGGRVLENVPYTAASDFLGIDTGDRRIQVNVTGTDTTVIDAHATFAENTDYMIVAAGKAAQIAPIIVTADRTTPERDSARVRVLHAAPSAPAVDVYVIAAGGTIANAAPTLSSVPFKAISDYLSVKPGVYDVFVTLAGTKTVAIEVRGLEISEQLIATVAALDSVGGGAPFALTVLDER